MAHNIRYGYYPENVDRKRVQAEWDDYVAHEDWQEGASGLGAPIRWIQDHICESEQEAEEYIKANDKGWYDQLAVRYKALKNHTKSKKLITLGETAQKTHNAYWQAESELYAQSVTSAYIGCKNCGSKLNRQYIKRNTCPLCGEDFRSDTTKKRIAALKKKWQTAQKNYEDAVLAETKKNYEIRWLVKIEYHT